MATLKKPQVEASDAPLTAAEFTAKITKTYTDLKPDAVSKISLIYGELIRFNKTINLVSATTLKAADAVHFGDCILAWRMLEKKLVSGQPVYDFGSGNGFPGLVFAVLAPGVKFVLVERDNRKAEYLKTVMGRVGLSNVEVMMKNVEELAAGSVANGVSRGFAPLHKTLLVTRKAFSKGGKLFHMKGDGWATELGSVPSQVFSHWSPSLLGNYKIPGTVAEMAIVFTEKISAD